MATTTCLHGFRKSLRVGLRGLSTSVWLDCPRIQSKGSTLELTRRVLGGNLRWMSSAQRSKAITLVEDNVTKAIPVTTDTLYPKEAFRLPSNPDIEFPAGSLRIKYSSIGDPSLPTVFLMPSMSNSVWAVDGYEDNVFNLGWWRGVIGYGSQFGIDLNEFHVLCGAPMGAPFGSTSPLTPLSGKNSKETWSKNFPQITPLDMAAHQKLLLNELGIEHVYAIVGGSMGGMQVLQFAVNYPNLYDVFVSIASTAQTSPSTVALRSVQRKVVRMDPEFEDGDYKKNPTAGMGIARMFGTICYRSPDEFDERFHWFPKKSKLNYPGHFDVEHYLEHQAHKFTMAKKYDANCWLLLSQAMDLQDIGIKSSFDESVRKIPKTKQAMLLSYSTDRLTPAADHERLACALGRQSVPVHYENLISQYGHDAFLLEGQAQQINVRLGPFLTAPKRKNVNLVRRLVKDLYEH